MTFQHEEEQHHCASATDPANPLRRLVAAMGGRESGCANRSPWWANALIGMAAGIAAAAAANIATNGNLRWTGIAGLAVLVVVNSITSALDPTSAHGFCAVCGLCSVDAGVPPARTLAKANQNLRDAGWTISPDGKKEACPQHASYFANPLPINPAAR